LHNWRGEAVATRREIQLARKRKHESFRATKAVKAAAREHIGSPQPTRVTPDGKKQQRVEKHKLTTAKLLAKLDET
jgi:hypothetical protein